MKIKLLFLFASAAVAVTAQTAADAVYMTDLKNYGDSSLVTLLKVKIGYLNRQMAVCESLLATATRKCQSCKCLHMHFILHYYFDNHALLLSTAVYYDCKDAYKQGNHKNGIYTLNPDNGTSFQAYCDMDTDGGGWTVFQRRMDGSVNFLRNWSDYVKGFGNPDREHWLGLEKIHRLTKASSVLRVDMTSYSKGSRYAKYTFKVEDAASRYTLLAKNYSGNAGNSLGYHNQMKFSTIDSDNDQRWSSNCAIRFKGGWWFNNCLISDLNGVYAGRRVSSVTNCVWYSFDGWYSLKFTEMKTRRQ